MTPIALANQTDWQGWREAARRFILAGIKPDELTWSVGGEMKTLPGATGSFNVPRALVALASNAIQARDPDRFGLLYRLVWRVNAGEKLLEGDQDWDLQLVRRMALTVRADAHRMRTNLRFLSMTETDGQCFLGWFDPAHFVLRANARLMARRFPDRVFSIITPDESSHWNGEALRFGPGLREAQDDEFLRHWWREHRAAVLGDSVENTSGPEIEELDEAPRPPERPAIGPVVLRSHTRSDLITAVKDAGECRRCPLYEPATQTVFGEGPASAAVMFIGEQAGDQEDTIGRPFVGPAGQMMDRAMEEAGIDRRTVYVTNAVKHFKFTLRGKRRIHQTPQTPEIRACDYWLDIERKNVRPQLLVLLGATAARAVLGRAVTIGRERGRPIQMEDGQILFVTVHPSFLLRIPDPDGKAREYAAFVNDLKAVRALIDAT